MKKQVAQIIAVEKKHPADHHRKNAGDAQRAANNAASGAPIGAGGGIGYFPSYALGSAYGAQLIAKMKETVDVEAALEKGDFTEINEWNRQHIWCHGRMMPPGELLEKALVLVKHKIIETYSRAYKHLFYFWKFFNGFDQIYIVAMVDF